MTFPAVRSSSMADRRAIALMQMKLLGELFLKQLDLTGWNGDAYCPVAG